MCGILAIINTSGKVNLKQVRDATAVIRHRGPDDEGILLWNRDNQRARLAGPDTNPGSVQAHALDAHSDMRFDLALGHRRLSILDLSPAGHQPMVHPASGLIITYNGEVYNYLEIRADLQQLGHRFATGSDTEVILAAWQQWGPSCLSRFNGMFAFALFDPEKRKLYAVRDRFGVKPLYQSRVGGAWVLASEIKQITGLPEFRASLNLPVAREYLAFGTVDHTGETFDNNVQQVPGGHYLEFDLDDPGATPRCVEWYRLQPKKFTGTYEEAVEGFRGLLTSAVDLRLRSDVPVGSCLSGGLDSSAIVCLAAGLLQQRGDFAGQETVTACYDEERFDEWRFASEVIRHSGARSHRTFPTFAQLESEFREFLWHQDLPTGSSSQFSQWAVFKATHEAGLIVMVDGQGSDEQLAGYGGNEVPLFAGYLRSGQWGKLYSAMQHYRQEKRSWPMPFLAGALQVSLGEGFLKILPDRWRLHRTEAPEWIVADEALRDSPMQLRSLQSSLMTQVLRSPLPSLLRYEDRSSMAFSVESRTPFMDYRLMEFNLGLPSEMVFHNGVRKRVLRDAMKGIMPEVVRDRRDKMGFVTPEELWFKGEGRDWFAQALSPGSVLKEWIRTEPLRQRFEAMQAGAIPYDATFWRILSLDTYLQLFQS